MANYLIVPGNTDLNRGDQALIWESINILKEINNNANFRIILSGETEKERHIQSWQTAKKGYEFVYPLINHPNRGEKEEKNQYYSKNQYIRWGLRAVKDFVPRLLLLSRNSHIEKLALRSLSYEFQQTYDHLKKSKGIIFKGGGFIHSYGSIRDPYIMFYFLYYAMLAKKHNIKVVFMPNSFGPFKNKIAARMVKNVMKKIDLIAVREKISLNVLKEELNIDSQYYPDLGFFLKEDPNFEVESYLRKFSIPKDRKKVGITVRPYRFDGHTNPHQAYENYINSFKEFINYLEKNNFHPILIAQTMGPSFNEDDNEAIKAILDGGIQNNVTVISDINLDASSIKKIYKSMDYVVGTRFHSVIFSISSGTPSIAISYGGNKGKGIMEELGLKEYEIEIEQLASERLIKVFNELLLNEESYKKIIRDKMKEYNKLRDDFKLELNRKFH
ncbi:polysaccharide pyruvyl transferase family protein [Planococcus sp. NCCP-2050]|uniref:polysaccharide pyruvyl transferase family protein n=1 Tax=Planococcus sp. NCCP-2050 TaxID=2944679 RepID=UPI00203AE1BF|nr:polysaccharide pyruvyl transferase family protein [Planococcus sp. NCCP-2050]GKW45323.1 colanic acid biosynthesis pyruvyl transferase WcaK [Planococcus sp. NCCP-2050]